MNKDNIGELKATFTQYRTNFLLVEKFDRTFCSHGTVQYILSLRDTELAKRTKV